MTVLEYGPECVIRTQTGRDIHCPAFPDECSYVRIVENGAEVAYWTYEEWQEDPQLVMGAIFGAVIGGDA